MTRRRLLLPILVSGFLAGLLAVGGVLAGFEFIYGEQGLATDAAPWYALACGAGLWTFWSLVFFRLSAGREPRGVVMQVCRRLLQGSVITLLVAVPTHLVARSRGYCCAGFYTFVGIAFGLAVMLCAFGPGLYFLYVERWRKLHPEPPRPRG